MVVVIRMKSPIGPEISLATELLLIRADGTETPLTIRIGFPAKHGADWACSCEIAGLESQYPDIYGANSIQALCLALRLVRSRLCSVIGKGDVVCLPDDREPLTEALVNAWFGN